MTPNGRFKVDENICMSFTKFHPESWSPMWNIENMLAGLVSFMLEETGTEGAVVTSQSEKRRLAQASGLFNYKLDYFRKHF